MIVYAMILTLVNQNELRLPFTLLTVQVILLGGAL